MPKGPKGLDEPDELKLHYFHDFWRFVKPHRKPLRIVYVLWFLNAFMNLLPALSIRFYIDLVLMLKPAKVLGFEFQPPDAVDIHSRLVYTLVYLGVLALLILFANSIGVVMHRLTTKSVESVLLDIRLAIMSHINKMSIGYFSDERTGTIMTKAVDDATHLSNLLRSSFFLSYSLIQFLVAPVLMVVQSPLLFAVALLPVPMIIYAGYSIHVKLKPMYRRQRESISVINSQVQETISGIREIKAFNMEGHTSHTYRHANREQYNVQNEIMRVWSVNHQIMYSTADVARLLITGVGGLLILYGIGGVTIGTVTAFIVLANFVYNPVQVFINFYNVVLQGTVALERIIDFMRLSPDLEDRHHSHRMTVDQAHGHIEFSDVCFHYREDTPILRDINLDVSPGEKIALVGPTGSGKSTLVSLLLRFYDPANGVIRVDGHDIREYKQNSLRRNMGIVFQDTFLFYGTIRDNLLFANPNRSEDELVEACRAANVLDSIMEMPDGLDTKVGERGATLSGGQRQRLAIARVFLKDPPIVVLDEATSAVDTVTERLIQESIERMLAGRTAFIIAHRLSTIRNCGRILVLDHGSIAEIGSHEELLAKDNGLYREFVEQSLM